MKHKYKRYLEDFMDYEICSIMGATIDEIINDYWKSFLDEELLAPRESPQYQRDSAVVHEILSKMNNGEMVTEENLRGTAERYLITKVALSVPELECLKERLAGKVFFENNTA
jgi:hypothetical protein